MPNKTLYVSDEDEAIWSKAQRAGEGGERSLSKVVAVALAEYLANREAKPDGGSLLAEAEERVAGRVLVSEIRALIHRHGVNGVSWAFGRALVLEGGKLSRAAAKTQVKLGRAGRQAAAAKAVATKGVAGQQRAARKAAATRKAKAGKGA